MGESSCLELEKCASKSKYDIWSLGKNIPRYFQVMKLH